MMNLNGSIEISPGSRSKGDARVVISIGSMMLILILLLFGQDIISFVQQHLSRSSGAEPYLTANEMLTAFCFRIESVANDTIYIRNCGRERIFAEMLMVYVDEKLVEMEADRKFIDPGQIMAVRIKQLSEGVHEVKITNGIVKQELRLVVD